MGILAITPLRASEITVARRAALLVLGLLMGLALGFPTAMAEPQHLRVALISDLDRMEGGDLRGGYARLATAVNDLRAEAAPLLLLHAGDALSPSLLSGFDKGSHHIDFLNRLKPSAMTPGNHEFDFGPEVARTRFAEASFPLVASNLFEPDGAPLAGTVSSLTFEAGDYRIGVLGLLTPATKEISSPGDVVITPPLEAAAEAAAALREAGADLILALVHLDESEDRALADSGLVDIVLSGHDHVVAAHYDGKALLMESGAQAEQVMVLDLALDRVEGRDGPRFTWYPTVQTLDTGSLVPDPEMATLVESYQAGLSAELDVDIGTSEVELDSRRASVRGGETAIGNLIADAMRAAVDAEVGLTNGGGIRGDKIYDAGSVLKRRDIQTELPFGNKTVKLEVTGATLLSALENGVGKVEEGAGRFPHVSGMSFVYDPAKVPGARVTEVRVGDAPLELERSYTLATNDYIARGGDGYEALRAGTSLIDAVSARFMASQVIEYIEAAGAVAPSVEGRIGLAQ